MMTLLLTHYIEPEFEKFGLILTEEKLALASISEEKFDLVH